MANPKKKYLDQTEKIHILSAEEVEQEPVAEDLTGSDVNNTVQTPIVHDEEIKGNPNDETIVVGKTEELKEAQQKDPKMPKAKKQKVYKNGINWVGWICALIIAIPVGIFAYILFEAFQTQGTPILGNRFEGDLNPAITAEDMTGVTSDIKALEGVEDCVVNTVVATTRVSVNVNDDLTNEQIKALADLVYKAVDAKLPIATYYTNTDDKTMYDLEINVYNNLDYETKVDSSPKFIMYTVVKNGKMENYITQDVSTSLNPTLAAQLLQDVIDRDKEDTTEDTTDTTEVTDDDAATVQE
jgi:hypothetical protein